jgi:hypothetical protein
MRCAGLMMALVGSSRWFDRNEMMSCQSSRTCSGVCDIRVRNPYHVQIRTDIRSRELLSPV